MHGLLKKLALLSALIPTSAHAVVIVSLGEAGERTIGDQLLSALKELVEQLLAYI